MKGLNNIFFFLFAPESSPKKPDGAAANEADGSGLFLPGGPSAWTPPSEAAFTEFVYWHSDGYDYAGRITGDQVAFDSVTPHPGTVEVTRHYIQCTADAVHGQSVKFTVWEYSPVPLDQSSCLTEFAEDITEDFARFKSRPQNNVNSQLGCVRTLGSPETLARGYSLVDLSAFCALHLVLREKKVVVSWHDASPEESKDQRQKFNLPCASFEHLVCDALATRLNSTQE